MNYLRTIKYMHKNMNSHPKLIQSLSSSWMRKEMEVDWLNPTILMVPLNCPATIGPTNKKILWFLFPNRMDNNTKVLRVLTLRYCYITCWMLTLVPSSSHITFSLSLLSFSLSLAFSSMTKTWQAITIFTIRALIQVGLVWVIMNNFSIIYQFGFDFMRSRKKFWTLD